MMQWWSCRAAVAQLACDRCLSAFQRKSVRRLHSSTTPGSGVPPVIESSASFLPRGTWAGWPCLRAQGGIGSRCRRHSVLAACMQCQRCATVSHSLPAWPSLPGMAAGAWSLAACSNVAGVPRRCVRLRLHCAQAWQGESLCRRCTNAPLCCFHSPDQRYSLPCPPCTAATWMLLFAASAASASPPRAASAAAPTAPPKAPCTCGSGTAIAAASGHSFRTAARGCDCALTSLACWVASAAPWAASAAVSPADTGSSP